MKKRYKLKNLNCASCALKIEDKLKNLEGIDQINLNFNTQILDIKLTKDLDVKYLEEEIKSIEDDVDVLEIENPYEAKILLNGLNCVSCGEKIVDFAKGMEDVVDAQFSLNTQILLIYFGKPYDKKSLIDSIKSMVNSVEPGVRISYVGEEKEEKENPIKKQFLNIVALVLFIIGFTELIPNQVMNYLLIIAYLLVGYDINLKAFKNIYKGNMFDENFLMTLATYGAFGIGEFQEAVGVMIFYKVGEYFQDMAVDNSRRSIKSLINIKPDYANINTENGLKKINPEMVNLGDTIIVKPGERVPLDGEIIKGESLIDQSALTGESVPVQKRVGDIILSGGINKENILHIKVNKSFYDSTVNKIIDMVENASAKKAKTEQFITKFSKVYTPIVVTLAAALVIIPTLVVGNFSLWFSRALIFLVISCPCALVVSVPLGFFGGIGRASKNGILVKGGNYLEALNGIKNVVFDKTGTLTHGVFKVTNIFTVDGIKEKDLIKFAAYGEAYSNHPIAKTIIEYYKANIDINRIENHLDISGKGVYVKLDNKDILVGNSKLMNQYKIDHPRLNHGKTVVYVAVDEKYIGYIIISDEIKDDSKKTIKQLTELGIDSYILTGDNEEVANLVAGELGVTKYYSNLLPEDKASIYEEIREGGPSVFVGDGINDAPVLAQADIGISMGGIGQDAAIEASDMVIMNDEPSKLIKIINIAKKTRKVVVQNIVLALGVKVIVMILGTFGLATMWMAIFADVGVALLAILNSIRTLRD